MGLRGRSTRRETRVSASLGRPSRLLNPPLHRHVSLGAGKSREGNWHEAKDDVWPKGYDEGSDVHACVSDNIAMHGRVYRWAEVTDVRCVMASSR